MISISRTRQIKISQDKAIASLALSKKSNEPVYLVLIFNIQGREHSIVNIESSSNVDKLLTSKYLLKAKNCKIAVINRKHNIYYAYPLLSSKIAELVLKRKVSKYIEIEFKDEHIFSIMSIYQQLTKKQHGVPDELQLVDMPPIWYEPTKDILYDLYGNKSINKIIDRQNTIIKNILKER